MATNVNKLYSEKLTYYDHLVIWITSHASRVYLIYFCWVVLVFALSFWTYLPLAQLLFSSITLLFLPLIIVSQSLQRRHAELLADEISKSLTGIEKDMEDVSIHLDVIESVLIKNIKHKIGI